MEDTFIKNEIVCTKIGLRYYCIKDILGTTKLETIFNMGQDITFFIRRVEKEPDLLHRFKITIV